MKTGLVLEGGAMRGMYTCGVLDVFLDNGIDFDGVIGVSAGALFGVNFVSKQRGRGLRYNKRFCVDKRYMGLYSLITTGDVINKEFAYYTVPREYDLFDDETYKKGIPFYAVITNVETGEPEYPRLSSVYDDMEVLRASGTMPFLSKPVEISGKYYLDGGIADSIPFEKFMEMGYEKLVVVLTKPKDYVKGPLPERFVNSFYGKKYPGISKRLINRHNEYNESIEKLLKLESEGKVFVIRPSETPAASRIEKNPDKLQQTYDLGIKDGNEVLTELLAYLNK